MHSRKVFILSMIEFMRENTLMDTYKLMITVFIKIINHFSQKIYNDILDSLQFHQLKCPCGCSGMLIRHGSYNRTLKFQGESLQLSILRLKCKSCGHTHAILPSAVVPYSQIPLKDQQDILAASAQGESTEPVMNRNPLIDENNVKSLLRQYRKHWKERLSSIGVTLSQELVTPCFSHFSRQFMQMKKTPNLLFCATHITLPDICSGNG